MAMNGGGMRRMAALLGLALLGAGCQVGATGRINPQVLAQADEAFLREQYSQAAGLYESFLQDNPNDPAKVEIRLQAGKARAGAGQPDAALQQYDLALGAQPDPSLRWEIQFRKAVVLRLMGDPARAVSLFRLVAQAPASERGRAVSSDELYWEYAAALFRAGDFRAGQAELGKVSPKGPYERKLIPRLGLTGFTVQVGAYADRAAAEAEAAKVKGALKPVVFDKVLYIVTSGLFARYDEALLEADRLRRQGYREVMVLP
jgi:tetratricopeptide (TPR) repeat protein